MPEDFDPYYLWLGIPPHERPANHYRLLGIELFEQNLNVIDSAADRQMAHLRSVQAGKHSALSQRLLNEIAAAKICLLRPEQKARYDAALRAKLEAQAAQSATRQARPTAAVQPQAAQSQAAQPQAAQPRAAPLARAQPLAANPTAAGGGSFWDDLTGAGEAPKSPKVAKPQTKAAPLASSRVKNLWPVFLVAGACVLLGVVIIGMKVMGDSNEPATPVAATAKIPANTSNAATIPAARPKSKKSLLIFDWPAEDRVGMTVTVDGANVPVPQTGTWEYPCLPGPHKVIASRPGFQTIEEMVDARVDGSRRISDTWHPLAALSLDWSLEARDGAVLSVDGQVLTVAADQPLIVPVEPGNHTVSITRLGYLPFEKSVAVSFNQSQSLSVNLQATAATLVVRWPAKDRAGAELRIDGEARPVPGDAKAESISLPLPPGKHTVQINRHGFEPFSQTLTVSAADQKVISPNWVAKATPNAVAASSGEAPKIPNSNVAASSKHPVPSAAEQEKIGKQLDELYKPAHDSTKDLAQSKELCNLAQKAAQLPERYMLLVKGADFALQAGDLSLAVQAVVSLDSEFEVPAFDIKAKMLDKFVKVANSSDQISDAVSTAERLIDEAMSEDRYDAASAIIATASKFLIKRAADPDFHRDSEKALANCRSQIKTLQPLWEATKKAKQTIATNPNDADANNQLGRWYCFYKGDWKTGLPFFAKSGNERIKPVADQELKPPKDAAQKVALADQWWDIAQKETGSVGDAIHLHAGDLYRSALPDLNSVVKKASVEKRLTEVADINNRIREASGLHTGPLVFQRNRWVDVLRLVDVNRDAAGGNWARNGSDVICGSFANYYRNLPRLYLPIVVEGDYDLEVDFTRANDNSFLHTIFFVGKRPAGLVLNASFSGLDGADGDGLDGFYRTGYGLDGSHFQSGRRFQQIISVRLGKGNTVGVDVSIDGRQFLPHFENDSGILGIDAQSHANPMHMALEVGYGGTVAFNAVRLRMVSGQGHSDTPAKGKPN